MKIKYLIPILIVVLVFGLIGCATPKQLSNITTTETIDSKQKEIDNLKQQITSLQSTIDDLKAKQTITETTVIETVAETTIIEKQTFNIGEDLSLTQDGVPIGRFIIRKIENYASINKYAKPSEGTRWITMDVEEQNLSSEVQSYNALNYSLGDADGYRYDKVKSGGKEPTMESGELAPNNKIRGWVTIEVPKDITITEIYASPLYSSPPTIINVSPPLS
jgi:cell division protein FtsB